MKRQRRGKGEGSILERADGRWQVQVDLGRGIDGRRQRKYVYTATQSEAVDMLRRLGGRAVDGQLLATTTPTVAKFLDDWFDLHRDDWRPNTRRNYRCD